jgi:hypothetical protein
MALGSTQILTEMSTRNLPGGKGRPARKADSLTAICEPEAAEAAVLLLPLVVVVVVVVVAAAGLTGTSV